MITCAFCKFSDPHAFVGYKSELRFISTSDGTKEESVKRFLCSVECYVQETLQRSFYKNQDPDVDVSEFQDYIEKNQESVRAEIMGFPSIKDFHTRNGLHFKDTVSSEPVQLNLDEEIKDWADC